MTKAEYENRFHANQNITGHGLETTCHMPCPFCAAPDFMIYRVLEVNEAIQKGAVCKECKRGMKGIVTETRHGSSTEIVQTEGDEEYHAWAPAMRRVDSDNSTG